MPPRPTHPSCGEAQEDDVIRLRGGGAAAGEARAELTERLGGRLADERLAELQLIVTELVTNSVRHGGVDEDGAITLRLRLSAERVRVELRDSGRQGQPRPRQPDVDRGGGFGLLIVDALALDWGVRHDPELLVWIELARG